MAWSSEDQNPAMGASAAYGGNYAATLNAATSGSSAAPTMTASASSQPSYADRLNATNPAQPKTTSQALAQFETRETNQPRATSTDRTNAARRYTKEVSTVRGDTARAQGDQAYDLLHPQFVQRFALAARQAQAEGIPVGIYSAYRPPNMRVGGFGDKYKSTHAYGIGSDVSGIGRPGSDASKRWNEIATENGLINPYGPNNRKEWNHYQLVPEKSAYQIPGLRDTITGSGPIDPEQMWAASGVDPEGVPYTGGGTDRMVGNNAPPNPRMRPDRTEMAYAPAPEAQAPFDAVLDPSANRRPQAPTPRTRPQRDTLQAPAPTGGEYVVRRGDNLSRIARQAGVSVQEIARANGIRNPDQINEGQRLVIPGGQAAPQQPAQVDMPTPRMRPERGANVPNPRMRPQQPQSQGEMTPEEIVRFATDLNDEIYHKIIRIDK